MHEQLRDWIKDFVPEEAAGWISYGIVITGLLVVCLIAGYIARRWLMYAVATAIQKSKNKYDDIFLEKQVFQRLSWLAPAMVISVSSPLLFDASSHNALLGAIDNFVAIYIMIVGGLFFSAVLSAIAEIYNRKFGSTIYNPKGLFQALRIVLVLIVITLVIAKATGRTPMYLLGGLGALTAVILLIFKDTILGFVAGIQLAFNKMVQIGDWVTAPHAGADGDVIDITLTTVKIQNWDKTISHVPIYSLTTNAFTNWRGMSESGGRRIKRSLFIDMNSVRFCDEPMLKKLAGFRPLENYLKEKKDELQKWRAEKNLPETDNLNGRQLTNLGTFRAYVSNWLRDNPHIHTDRTFIVRYLAPTPKGLPLEIYVFSNDQRWVQYEGIQADILDHLLAILPEFKLRIFQDPSGHDFQTGAMNARP